ncbi:MAG: hypothetical protein IKP47_10200 [Ruminococcus sp.]|nr:hypothetical protein [Ruminococcus sp.]
MKKLILPILAGSLILASCGDTSKVDDLISKASAATQPTLSPTDEALASEAESLAAEYWSQAEKVTVTTAEPLSLEGIDVTNGDIDVDLTKLSGNLCYAQVFELLNNPEEYLGKRVRAKGTFAYTTDESTGGEYFAVFIADASACCAQGIEFVLTGQHTYPADYPEIGADITVEGIFNRYEENGWQYCQLKDATLQTS